MADNEKTLNVRVSLRRDLESNYSSTMKPLKGELCFVDTAEGLRIKVGDGNTLFPNLPYEEIQEVVVRGYYLNNKFYKDSTYISAVEIQGELSKIYFDLNSKRLYIYNNGQFESVTVPNATAEVPGILKLYDVKGDNIDGTITQLLFTSTIENLFGVDEDTLVLEIPWEIE